ncbi:MAG TPA: serine/threonine-protein kinase [Bryobacteraceae bacterium]
MDKIGPFEILETLHLGPQPLYRAKAPDGRVVAVKTIPVKGLSAEMRERFMREAETCRMLEHPNLVRVFESGEANGMLYQAMELLEGSDLGEVLAEGRKFTWEEKLSIMEQVCDGLQFAHEHKLVHRDIKPANLFLENSGRVRVVDFGMVRVVESELTQPGSAVGTLNYMAPEQIRGERCTPATDVFSTGIVFYQLASGQHPFSSKDRSLVQVVSAIVFETPPSLGGLCPDAPEGLEFILNKALEKDPAKRIQNAGDLKQAMSLCRITMRLGPKPMPSAGAETKIIASAQPAGPAPVSAPVSPMDEKTKVLKRAALTSQPSPDPSDRETVPRPPSPPRPVALTPSVAPIPSAPPDPSVPPAPNFSQGPTFSPGSGFPQGPAAPRPAAGPKPRYCPSCTTGNPPTATICRGCGNPLGGGEEPAQPKQQIQWGLYLAIGAAVLLAIALVVVLIVKK